MQILEKKSQEKSEKSSQEGLVNLLLKMWMTNAIF